MLSLLFMTKKRKQSSLEEIVIKAQQGDELAQHELIDSYKPFIAKTVSSVCKRYIYETDDEFSIGLIAFNEAIEKFSSEKGHSLLSFAEVLIKRRVIDYIRKQAKTQAISFQANIYDDEENSRSSLEDDLSIEDYYLKSDAERRRDEILAYQKVLSQYDLSFSDLIEQSPKHADARKNAMLVAKALVDDEELKEVLIEKKRLPIKQLETKVEVSRKTIERNRKYIIAVAIILTGKYVYLQEYIKGVIES